MKVRKINRMDFVSSQWSGGETTQITIAPEGALYKDRDFLFRLSFATCNIEKSDFTSLPDYDRIISVIKGKITLKLGDRNEEVTISPYDIFNFDGGEQVTSIGKCTDFNLMLRKGKVKGRVLPLDVDGEYDLDIEKGEKLVLFCTQGNFTYSFLNEETKVESFEGAEFCEFSEPCKMPLKGFGKGFAALITNL